MTEEVILADPIVADMSAIDEGPASFEDLMATDSAAEEDGKWFYNITGATNPARQIDVKLRSLTSKNSIKANQQARLMYRKYWKNNKWTNQEIPEKIGIFTVGAGCVVGWKGINDKDLKPIDCTPETAVDLLTRFKHFRIIVTGITQDADKFRTETEADTLGN